MNPEYESSWQFLVQVMNTMHILLDEVEPELSQMQLEPKGFFLLGMLEENPHPAQLAKALSLPGPTVTFLLKRLESNEYVKRSSEPGDLRKFRFTLTPAGRKVLIKGQAVLAKSFDRMLGHLSATDRKQLFKLFAALK